MNSFDSFIWIVLMIWFDNNGKTNCYYNKYKIIIKTTTIIIIPNYNNKNNNQNVDLAFYRPQNNKQHELVITITHPPPTSILADKICLHINNRFDRWEV